MGFGFYSVLKTRMEYNEHALFFQPCTIGGLVLTRNYKETATNVVRKPASL